MKCSNYTQIIFYLIISVFAIYSCRTNELIDISEKDRLINSLSTQVEVDFFDFQYLSQKNRFIVPRIKPRTLSNEELIDSLFNSLVRLELQEPYVAQLVDYIGYPYWQQALVHEENDSLYHTITIPFAGINDSLTKGMLTSVLADGNWNYYIVRRDTLYNFLGTISAQDPNLPGYLLGMLHYDSKMFARSDSILRNLYFNNFYNGFQENEPQILPRACVVLNITACFDVPCPEAPGGMASGEDFNHPIETREDCYIECVDFLFLTGCGDSGTGEGTPSGVGETIGSGSGSTGTGNNENNNGNGNGNGTGCGLVPPYNNPLLCPTIENMNQFGLNNINTYNGLLEHLSAENAAWLLTQPTALWQHYAQLLNSYSSEVLAGFILNRYTNYIRDSRVTTPLNFSQISSLLTPLNGKLTIWENIWLNNNIHILSEPSIEDFLNFLSIVNLSSINAVEWVYENPDIQHVTLEFLEEHDDAKSSIIATEIIELAAADWLTNPYPIADRELIIEKYGGWLGHGLPSLEGHLEWLSWMSILANEWQLENPDESLDDCFSCILGIALKAKWNVISNETHTILQVVGMIPGCEPADLIDGVVYLIEGDNESAMFSLASTLPIVGWTANGARYARVAVKVGANSVRNLTFTVLGNGFIEFGSRSTLRTIIGLPKGDPRQAHHLLSWSTRFHEVL